MKMIPFQAYLRGGHELGDRLDAADVECRTRRGGWSTADHHLRGQSTRRNEGEPTGLQGGRGHVSRWCHGGRPPQRGTRRGGTNPGILSRPRRRRNGRTPRGRMLTPTAISPASSASDNLQPGAAYELRVEGRAAAAGDVTSTVEGGLPHRAAARTKRRRSASRSSPVRTTTTAI